MSSIPSKIKNVLPKRLLYHYYLKSATFTVLPDLRRSVEDKVFKEAASSKLERHLSIYYHNIEKGLTTPEPKTNFKKELIKKRSKTLEQCKKFNLKSKSVGSDQSLSVLEEYLEFHKTLNLEKDKQIEILVKLILEKKRQNLRVKQLRRSSQDYFSDSQNPFDKFCISRYSVRHYTDKDISMNILNKCIKLAQKLTSFCNRQPTKLYIVKDKSVQKKILALQNGNRGFGHFASTLLVITSDISVIKDIYERNENHLNGGMFIMTLLNALHFYQISACSLNWSIDEPPEQKLRKILHLKNNEIPLMNISCGYTPKQLAIAASPRKPTEEIITIH